MDTAAAGVVVTGMGAICPIGKDIPGMLESLRQARDGFGIIQTFDVGNLKIRHAAEVRDFDPAAHFTPDRAARLDRTAQLAIVAVRQAVEEADLSAEALASGRVALVMGICAGGVGGKATPPAPGPDVWADREYAESILRTAHYVQSDDVASELGLAGPCITVSTACASSTSTFATALSLLDSGKVDTVIVCGADAYSMTTYAGFYALGAMAEKPTSPFSAGIGVTFGEGAGCVVLERENSARARNALMHVSLLGCGATSDAYHITSPHPSGEGLQRAMRLAIEGSDLTPADIGYVNAHGTGTQDNDVSETLAIRGLFADREDMPPTSSSKSYFGHALGATGILEFIVSVLGMNHGFIPPTLNFEAPRAGCDLDYVPNQPRPGKFDSFLSSSAAFGGVNAAAVGTQPGRGVRKVHQASDIWITGLGVLSPIGAGNDDFLAGLREGRTGIGTITRFDTGGLGCSRAGQVPEFNPRKLAPTVNVRRMDSLTQFAVLATSMAMNDAGLMGRIKPERLGLHVALTRGPVATQQAFLESLARDGIEGLSAKYFPSMVLSTLSGQVAQACQIKGANFTLVDGAGAGLSALVHARHYLARHPELDALVLVAADELAPLFFSLFDRVGRLAGDGGANPLYGDDGTGLLLGEGAVALVLERAEHARSRHAKPYGRIAGTAQACEARADESLETDGKRLEAVAREAVQDAGGPADLIYGQARGVARHDLREARALSRLINGHAAAVSCLNGQTGLCEAASSLMAVGAALLGMRHGEAYPAIGAAEAPSVELPLLRKEIRRGTFHRAMVLNSSEHGNNTAVIFETCEGAPS